MASAISTASLAPAHPDLWILVARVDGPGLLRQPFERPHRESGQQPSEYGRRGDREQADQDHPAMQVVGVGDGGVVGGADFHQHRVRRRDVHRAHPVTHPVDVGVGVTGGQLGQRDGGVGGDLAVDVADGDDRVLVAGRLRNFAEPAGQERDRETGRLVQPAVQPFLAVVGDAEPDDSTGDQHRDGRTDDGRHHHAGAQRWRAGQDSRQEIHVQPRHCIRRTNPTPRTVCSSRGPPPASSLRRRYPMNTSTTLVSAAKS